jgi:DNA-directed RNA polymerase specialized sigma24 family protein
VKLLKQPSSSPVDTACMDAPSSRKWKQPSSSPVDTACMEAPSSREVPWIDAFRQQATDALFAQCLQHARSCLHAYRLYDAPEDALDLVQKALADILGRRVQWDPARRSLAHRVCDVLRYRVRDLKRGATKRRAHASIIDDEEHDEARVGEVRKQTLGDEVLHVEMSRLGGEPDHPEARLRTKQARELGARIGAELAVLVAQDGDDQVAAILACWGAGTCERRDILAETGMSAEAYHDARRRLVRLAGRLSNELRAKGKAQAE